MLPAATQSSEPVMFDGVHFDWSINISEIVAAISFLFGIGAWMQRISSFMKDSRADRKAIWDRMDRMHAENREVLRELRADLVQLIEMRRR